MKYEVSNTEANNHAHWWVPCSLCLQATQANFIDTHVCQAPYIIGSKGNYSQTVKSVSSEPVKYPFKYSQNENHAGIKSNR